MKMKKYVAICFLLILSMIDPSLADTLENTQKQEEILSFYQDKDWNQENIKIGVESGFPSIYEKQKEIKYQPKDTDRLKYDWTKRGSELFESILFQNGFCEKANYSIKELDWFVLWDERNFFFTEKNKTVYLSGEDIYEEEVQDENSKIFRYYQEEKGILYEVSKVKIGEEEKVYGVSICPEVISGLSDFRYTSLSKGENAKLCDCFLTEWKKDPAIYTEWIDLQEGKRYIKEWTSVKTGLSLAKYVFSEDGSFISGTELQKVEKLDLTKVSFQEPADISYQDMTSLLYGFLEDGFSLFQEMAKNYFIEETFFLTLESEERKIELYVDGKNLDKTGVKQWVTDMKDKTFSIFSFREKEKYYTIIPSKKLVESYEESVGEWKYFNFEKTALRRVKSENQRIQYLFEDIGVSPLSGLCQYYEYSFDKDTKKLISISLYQANSYKSLDEGVQKEVFFLKGIQKADGAIFSLPKGYKRVENYGGNVYDGEHPPFWWQN